MSRPFEPVRAPSLGEYAAALRRWRGMTQVELGDKSGNGVSHVRKVESGEIRHPRPDSLDNLAGCLRLDPAQRRLLFELAGARAAAPLPSVAAMRASLTPPQLASLLEFGTDPAAFVDIRWNVLAHNEAFEYTFPELTEIGNMLLWYFASPAAKLVLREWPREAALNVAWVRGLVAERREEAWVEGLLAELEQYPEFVEMWHRAPQVVYGRHPADDLMQMADPITRERYTMRVAQHPIGTNGDPILRFVGTKEEYFEPRGQS